MKRNFKKLVSATLALVILSFSVSAFAGGYGDNYTEGYFPVDILKNNNLSITTEYLLGLEVGMKVGEVKENFLNPDSALFFNTQSVGLLNDDIIKTGYNLSVTNYSSSIKCIVKGDTNSDNILNVSDVVTVRKIILGQSASGVVKKAADYDLSGAVSVTDIVALSQEILK